MARQAIYVCLLAGVLSCAAGAGTVGASAANPPSAATGVATRVTFTSQITDAGLIGSSVNLQQVDSSGRATVIGVMHDDGLDGDATANDHVFSYQFSLFQQTPGSLTFRVSAAFQGSLARAFSAPIVVNVTGTGTAINITEPAPSAYLHISPVVVRGTVGTAGAAVVVNGVAAQVSSTSFSASVPLIEGSNTLTVVATNLNGTTATASETVTLDTTPPHVTIDTPSNNATTVDSTANVTGIVNDIVVGTVNPQQATVTVNGIPAVVTNRTYVASGIPVAMGQNTISAVARDRAGNFATTNVTIVRQALTQPSLRVVSGNNLSAPIQSLLAAPLVVKAVNGAGQPIANTPVVFRVTGGDGTVTQTSPPGLPSIAVNTDSQGQAQVRFILGTRAGAGNNQVEASAAGIATTAVFTESATAAPAARIVVDSGNNQTGVVGQALPLPFIAIVTDAGHNRLGGVPVTFTVKNGGGTIGGQSTFSATSDSDGRVQAILTLGLVEGFNNNVVEANFAGNSGLPVAFTAGALVPGAIQDTRITGVVLDNSNIPIPGVSMRLFQVNNGANANVPQQVVPAVRTDANGFFEIRPAPVGVFKLMADGSTASRPGPFPTLEYDLVTVAGRDVNVGLPIYLPALSAASSLCVTATTGGTLTIPQAPGFALTIAPGSATFPGGSRSGCVSVTPVNIDKVPMVPGFGQQPRFVVTIQPVGTTFNPPAAITIPNVDGLAPRATTEMYSYDHDLAAFVAIGTGVVSDDGSVIASSPGVGVLKAGWHCGGDPAANGSVADCPSCQICRGNSCQTDPAQAGNRCEDSASSYTYRGVTVNFDASCRGVCKDGSCQKTTDGFNFGDIKTAVNSAIDKIMGTCIGNDTGLRDNMQNNLRNNGLSIKCDGGAAATTCAYANTGTNRLTMAPAAYTPGCGPLDSSLLHEMVHGPGGDGGYPNTATHNTYDGTPPDPNDKAYGCEKACFGVGRGTAAACK